MDNADLDLLVGDLLKRLLNSLGRAANVSLNDNVKLLDTLGYLSKEVVKICSCVSLEGFFLSLSLTLLGKLSCHSLVLNCVELVTCERYVRKTDYFNRNRGSCFLNYLSVVVVHRSYTSNRSSRDNYIAVTERSVLNENGSHRSSTLIKLSLDDNTLCKTLGISAKLLDLCNEKHVLKQIVDTLLCESRHGNADRISAPFLGNEIVFRKLLLYSLGVSRGFIHLVDGYYYIYFSRLSVVDSLYRLGHYSVVSRNYKYCDIGCLRASRSHRGERLVSGSVKEGDILTVYLNSVSTDMLSDSSCLAGGYARVSDSVKYRGLSVVNVSHYTDYRRSAHECRLIVSFLVKESFLNGNYYLLGSRNTHFVCNDSRGVVIHRLVYRHHHTEHHKTLNHLRGSHLESGSEITYDYLLGKRYADRRFGNGSRGLLALSALVLIVIVKAHTVVGSRLLLDLEVSATSVGYRIGNEVIQLLVVLGKVYRACSHINNSRSSACLGIFISLYGLRTDYRLGLELLSGSVLASGIFILILELRELSAALTVKALALILTGLTAKGICESVSASCLLAALLTGTEIASGLLSVTKGTGLLSLSVVRAVLPSASALLRGSVLPLRLLRISRISALSRAPLKLRSFGLSLHGLFLSLGSFCLGSFCLGSFCLGCFHLGLGLYRLCPRSFLHLCRLLLFSRGSALRLLLRLGFFCGNISNSTHIFLYTVYLIFPCKGLKKNIKLRGLKTCLR